MIHCINTENIILSHINKNKIYKDNIVNKDFQTESIIQQTQKEKIYVILIKIWRCGACHLDIVTPQDKEEAIETEAN